MAKKAENVTLCMGHNTPMLKCIGLKKESEYFSSWSPFHANGKVPFCKECCNKIFQYYLDETKTAKAALYYTLMKMDTPFIKEVYEKVNDMSTTGNVNGRKIPISIGAYMNTIRKYSKNKEIWTDFSATNVDITDVDTKIQSREIKQKEMDQWEIDWGKQDEITDYEFLNDTFVRYTKNVEFVNPQQIDLYRDLCRDRLILRKINDGRYNGDESIDRVQNRIAKTMSILKVDQFTSNRPKTASEQSLFEKIRLCDEKNVKDVYNNPTKDLKARKDYDAIKEYNELFSLRPLGNMLVGHRDFNVSLEDLDKYDLRRNENS